MAIAKSDEMNQAWREHIVLFSAKGLGLDVSTGTAADALKTKPLPHDHVFNKTINSSGRLFMKQIAKHKAMNRKTKDPAGTKRDQFRNARHRVLLVDTDHNRYTY